MGNPVLFKKTVSCLKVEYTFQIRDMASLYLCYLLGNCTRLALALQDPITPSEIRKCISVMTFLTIFPGLQWSDFTVLFKNAGGFLCIS